MVVEATGAAALLCLAPLGGDSTTGILSFPGTVAMESSLSESVETEAMTAC